MDLELIEKLDQLTKIFNNSEEVKKLQKLKKEIYANENLKEKMHLLNKEKNNIYSEEYLRLKKEILSIDSVREFKKIENDLFLLSLSINKKLQSLIDEKGCHHENN